MRIVIEDVYKRKIALEYAEDDDGNKCVSILDQYNDSEMLLDWRQCRNLGSALGLLSKVLRREIIEEEAYRNGEDNEVG